MLNLNRKGGFWGLLKQEKWEPNSYDKQRKQGNFDHAGHAAYETLINVSHYNASTNNAPVDLVGGLKLVTPNQGLNRIYRGPRGATKISKIKNPKKIYLKKYKKHDNSRFIINNGIKYFIW